MSRQLTTSPRIPRRLSTRSPFLCIRGAYGQTPPEIGRSAVRPLPGHSLNRGGHSPCDLRFVRLGVRSPMTANDRETPGLTASCPELGHELGHGYRCGASLMRSGVGTSWSAGHDVYRTAGSDDDDGSAVLAHFVRGVARGWGSTGRTCISSCHLGPCSPPVTPSADRPLLPMSERVLSPRMTRLRVGHRVVQRLSRASSSARTVRLVVDQLDQSNW